MITGYNDTFNRTVSGGLGTATSGQAYTVFGTASQYSVAPSVASILPTATGDRFGYVDRQTSDIDITGQVALSGVPASNLMTVGFIIKRLDANNYYNATMMVATGGAISLRFSKVVAGSLSTITTVATGLTYVANTFYNLRVAVYWSNNLQAHVLQSKLWVVGGTEPGGWLASVTDAGLTQYTAGTGAGVFARDEAAAPGAVTAKIQNVAAKTYGLPVPATTDPMCNDPAITYPDQPVLQSLAQAADAVMTGIEPSVTLAGLFPRVRVSASNWSLGGFTTVPFNTTEYNVGTGTNLGLDSQNLYLPAGIWVVMFEVEMANSSPTDYGQMGINAGSFNAANAVGNFRIPVGQLNDDGSGGTGHLSTLTISTDPAAYVKVNATLLPVLGSASSYTVKYSALSAFRISDYFV